MTLRSGGPAREISVPLQPSYSNPGLVKDAACSREQFELSTHGLSAQQQQLSCQSKSLLIPLLDQCNCTLDQDKFLQGKAKKKPGGGWGVPRRCDGWQRGRNHEPPWQSSHSCSRTGPSRKAQARQSRNEKDTARPPSPTRMAAARGQG